MPKLPFYSILYNATRSGGTMFSDDKVDTTTPVLLWLSAFSTLVCFIAVVISSLYSITPFITFFGIFLFVYGIITYLSYKKHNFLSFLLLYFAINSGVFFLVQLLGSGSQTSSMFLVPVALPFFFSPLSQKLRFILSFIFPLILYYTSVFLLQFSGNPNTIHVAPFAEPALQLSLFISFWFLMYLFDKTRHQKQKAIELLALEKEWSRKLDLAREEAEQASSAKTQFLASLNHELRTPLHSVLGAVELLEGKKTPISSADLTDTLQIIHRGAEITAIKIEEILDYIDLESGKASLHERTVSVSTLKQIFQDLWETITDDYRGKKAFYWHNDGNFLIKTDVDRIKRVVSPLIQNAIQFSNSKVLTDIVLQSHSKGQITFSITVIDDGSGIKADIKQHLSEPFNTETFSYNKASTGLGMGLSTVHRSVELLDGKLSINDIAPHGTEISVEIRLPLVDIEKNSTTDKEVLIVDDAPANRKILEIMLQELGCKTEVAEDGFDAVQKVKEHFQNRNRNFDYILMDIQMPKMDGFCATCKIREEEKLQGTKAIPIFAISANASQRDRERAEEVGMNSFYAKPVNMNELKEALV